MDANLTGERTSEECHGMRADVHPGSGLRSPGEHVDGIRWRRFSPKEDQMHEDPNRVFGPEDDEDEED